MSNLKDIITTVAAIGLVVFTAIKTYIDSLNGGEINWLNLLVALAVAIIGYFTGKNPNGTTKKFPENV